MTPQEIRKLDDNQRQALRAAAELEVSLLNAQKARADVGQAKLLTRKTALELKQSRSRWRSFFGGFTQLMQVLVGVGGVFGGYLAAQIEYGSKKADLEKREAAAKGQVTQAEGQLAEAKRKQDSFEAQKELRELSLSNGERLRLIAEGQAALTLGKLEQTKLTVSGAQAELKQAQAEKAAANAETADTKAYNEGLRQQIKQARADLETVGKLLAEKKGEQATQIVTAAVAPSPVASRRTDCARKWTSSLTPPRRRAGMPTLG